MKQFIITDNNINKRLDKFLAGELKEFSRGRISGLIKTGSILVNNVAVKPSYLLKENDSVRILEIKEDKEIKANDRIGLDIIFENENFLVIDKAAGLQVHPSDTEKENTVVNGLIAIRPSIVKEFEGYKDTINRPGIVHRLDKDTSGLMVIAKNIKTHRKLKKAFQKRIVNKKYLALVHGHLKQKQGIIDKPIARSSDYKKQVIAGKKTKTVIREALTEFKVVREVDSFSLIDVKLHTGRMHQIRVHLAGVGHPIVGDKLYGKKQGEGIVLRQLLHSYSLSFVLDGEKHVFIAPIPADFRKYLEPTGN